MRREIRWLKEEQEKTAKKQEEERKQKEKRKSIERLEREEKEARERLQGKEYYRYIDTMSEKQTKIEKIKEKEYKNQIKNATYFEKLIYRQEYAREKIIDEERIIFLQLNSQRYNDLRMTEDKIYRQIQKIHQRIQIINHLYSEEERSRNSIFELEQQEYKNMQCEIRNRVAEVTKEQETLLEKECHARKAIRSERTMEARTLWQYDKRKKAEIKATIMQKEQERKIEILNENQKNAFISNESDIRLQIESNYEIERKGLLLLFHNVQQKEQINKLEKDVDFFKQNFNALVTNAITQNISQICDQVRAQGVIQPQIPRLPVASAPTPTGSKNYFNPATERSFLDKREDFRYYQQHRCSSNEEAHSEWEEIIEEHFEQ